MPSPRGVAGVTFALVAFAAPVALSQQASVFRARTDLVPVYVVAVDDDGNPVMDLTPEEFVLLDRGTPQTISVFDVVTDGPSTLTDPRFRLPDDLPRDVASNVSDQTERVVVVVVDDLHVYKNRTDLARRLAGDLIETLGPGSSMALLLTSGEGGTQITDDHATLAAAVDTIQGRKPTPRPSAASNPVAHVVLDPTASSYAQRQADVGGIDRSLQDFFDNMSLMTTLTDAARLLTNSDTRRKVFVLISEGIGWNQTWLPENTSECLMLGKVCYHDTKILEMLGAARRANIATYIVDPRGFVSDQDLMRECFPPPPGMRRDSCSSSGPLAEGALRHAQTGLDLVAELSGGFAITNSDDFDGGIRQIRSDLDNYYLLGFYPEGTGRDELRKLSVSTSRPGLTLRYRQSYQAGQPLEPEGPDDQSELTALATGAMQAPGVPLRMFAAALPGNTDGATVAVTIEVTAPRAAIETPDGRISDRLEYQIMAVNERSGRATQILSNTATVASTGPTTRFAEPDVRIHLPMTVTLRPGTYSVRASVTSEQLGRGGSVYLTLSVPDFANRPTRVGSIVLGSTLGPDPPSPRQNGPDDPIPFSPSLDRDFMRADALRVLFDVVRSGDQAVDVRLEAIDVENHVVMTLSERLSQGQPGRVLMTLPLDGLEPGAYRLRAVATTPAFTDQREVGIIVR